MDGSSLHPLSSFSILLMRRGDEFTTAVLALGIAASFVPAEAIGLFVAGLAAALIFFITWFCFEKPINRLR